MEIAKLMAELHFDERCGTVRDQGNFDAEREAKALKMAMKGLGTNEKIIIEVASKRTRKQRIAIREKYKDEFDKPAHLRPDLDFKSMFDRFAVWPDRMIYLRYDMLGLENLMKELKSELSGNLLDLTLALFMYAPAYDAKCMRRAMKGVGTNESVLIDILVSRTNDEIKALKIAYKKKYDQNLEEEVFKETSGDLRELLMILLKASRSESHEIDSDRAKDDAKALFKAGEMKRGTDESVFSRILGTRSYCQLRATFKAYFMIANRDITESIKREFSGKMEAALIGIVQVARCTPAYFAIQLFQAIAGAGTKEAVITRVIASRSEIDMVQIKKAFKALFKRSLKKFLDEEIGGDYKKLLVSIISNK